VNHKPGTEVPEEGVYWCTVCKKPRRFEKGLKFPECMNLCGRGYWQLVKAPAGGEKTHDAI
jgi:hypothetical protein